MKITDERGFRRDTSVAVSYDSKAVAAALIQTENLLAKQGERT